jgi:omega-amidase
MKVSILHMEIRNTLEGNLTASKTAVLKAAKQNPAIIALPEYFTVPNCMADFTNAKKISQETCTKTLDFLQKISQTIGGIYLLGGTVLEEDGGKYYNTSTLWRNGKLLAKYKKISPIRAELEAGVAKGSTPIVVDTEFGKLGMIVCADTFNPEVVNQSRSVRCRNRFVSRGCNGNPPDSSRPPPNSRHCAKLTVSTY